VPNDERSRIEAFTEWLQSATSTRTEPWRFGTALFNENYLNRWDSNFLRVERPLGETTVTELIAEADRVQREMRHREILVLDDAEGARMAMAFAEHGWEVDRIVTMALHGLPDRDPAIPIDEATFEEVRSLIVEVTRRAHPGASEADAAMLADFRRVLIEKADARFFVARVAGELAGCCELYVHDGVGQVEDVNTLQEFRNRGVARAFVLRAAHEARAVGADLVFLMADANDWPRQMYAKLGFEPVAQFWQFARPPLG
jgi:N-acetylglutamate synthase-like GNAT family acetyltransferase